MPFDERVTITMRSDMSAAFRQTVAGGRCVLIDEFGRKALRFQDVLRNSIRIGLASDSAIPSDQVLAELPAAHRIFLLTREVISSAGPSLNDRTYHVG